jgi:virulence-associated protein VapD
MKVKIKLECELDVSDFYEDERLNEKEKLEKLNEDFNDIETFLNHISYKQIEGNVVVKKLK